MIAVIWLALGAAFGVMCERARRAGGEFEERLEALEDEIEASRERD